MTITDQPVAAQYEAWVYPNPIPDMVKAITHDKYFDASDPSRLRRKYWPRNVEPDDLTILIAGCGANQAACIALTNPNSRVLGIDLSSASLAHEQFLKEKHDLANLELRQLPLEQVASLGERFDLIVSSGVLHHLPDPEAGLRALGEVLQPNGVMSLMLYGEYPRVGVHMLQEAFRLIGLQQDAEGIALVKHTLQHVVPPWHHVNSYNDPDRGFDAGLVDTFLHARERAYTVADVLQFVSDGQLAFQGWLDNRDYSVSARIPDADDPLLRRIKALPLVDQWKCGELIRQSIARQFFLVCHPDRPMSDYVLDFRGEDWFAYVPSLRSGLEILGERRARPGEGAIVRSLTFFRAGHRVELDAFEGTLFKQIDGERTIGAILGHDQDNLDAPTTQQRVQRAREFFQRMAEWDHVLYKIP